MSTYVPHQVVEDLLLQAPHVPEALHTVVNLVWFSLVNSVRDSPAEEGAATTSGFDAVSPAHAPPVGLWEDLAALFQDTTADHAVSVPGLDGWASVAHSSSPGHNRTVYSASPSTTTAALIPASAPTPGFASDSSSSPPCVSRPVPVVELSPLILRVLLWWAGRPQLPLRSSENTVNAAQQCSSRGYINRDGGSEGSTGGLFGEGCDCGLVLPERHGDGMRAQPLRLRIAEIFTLLCRHGGGAAVSDALLYGSCRTASELMAQRCHIVFSSFSNARWKVATALTPTPSTPLALSAGPVSTESFASPHSDHLRASARSGTHVMNQMLCALVDLHTCAASATRIPEMRPSPCSTTGTIVEADVVATGVLLRALLHCPPLHKRIVRLFSGDVHAIEPQHHRRGAQDVEVVSSSVSSAQSPQMFLPPSSSSGGVDMVDTRRHLHIFLPVLTHASPIVSAESWRTLAVLLFPSPAASLSSAVRRLLLLVPACPLQHLLAATLALPEDDSDGTRASAPLRPKPALLSCSHPMARNNALRLLHVLCTSTDLPPAVQSLFHQSPALLWRVLRLAAAVCKGIAVAHVALVRRVLVDYVMFSVEHRCSSGGGRPYPRTRFSVSTQTLLRENRGALARFLASTYAVWEGGDGFLAPEGAGGEWASACATASASMENGYDEGQILAVLHAL